MRDVFCAQMSIGQIGISEVVIDMSSRDDIPLILLGLQQIYRDRALRDAVFKILEEVVPHKEDGGTLRVVSRDQGRAGMDQWAILVLGHCVLG